MYNSPTTCDHIRIDNCTIGNSSTFAIRSYVGNTYLNLENNYLYNNFCNWSGLSGLSQECISLSGVTYGNIFGNYLWKNRVEQIDMKSGCSWMNVYNNTINTTGAGVYRNFWLSGGIGVYIDARGTCHNVSIYNNLIYGNHTGIQISNEGSSGRYENISIYNNIINVTNTTGGKPAPDGRMGIYVGKEGSSTSLNKDIDIYMNTVNLGTGNKYPCFQAGSTSYPLSTSLMKRLNVSNNIFTNNNKTSTSWWQYLNTAHIQIEGFSSTVSSTYIKFNNNLYNNSFSGTCNPRIAWDDGSFYQTSTTKWGNSPVMDPPEFVAPNPPKNYHLNATSPCIGAATSSIVSTRDYDWVSRPQGGTYDIGALEYVAGGGTPLPPTITGESPTNGSSSVTLPLVSISADFADPNGDTMTISFRTNFSGTWTTFSTASGGNGTYAHSLPGFTGTAKIWWSVNVTDSTDWTNETYWFLPGYPTEGITIDNVHANWTTTGAWNMTWNNGANTTHVYIYQKTGSYPTSITDPLATFIDSTTHEYYSHSADPSTYYFYALFPHNTVSALYGDQHNVSLVYTDSNTAVQSGASWLEFPGFLTTDKSVRARYDYSSNPSFTSTTWNETIEGPSYNTGYDSHLYVSKLINGTLSNTGQSFKTGSTGFYIYNVSIYASKTGSPGYMTISLWEANTSGATYGLPSGTANTTGSNNANLWTGTAWRNTTLTPYWLKPNTKYCIAASVPSGSPLNYVAWQTDQTTPTYTDGCAMTSIATYYTNSTRDCMFEIWGKSPDTVASFKMTSNTTLTTSQAYEITQTELQAGSLYYYRGYVNDSNGNLSRGNVRYSLTRPEVPTFLSLVPNFGNSSVNISWVTGTGANLTVLVYNTTGYPSTVAGGTVAYNGTGTFDITPSIAFNTSYYFTLFSFTVWGSLSRYSTPVYIPWGGISFNCYNESSGLPIHFNVLISDREGNHVYYGPNLYGSQFVNTSEIPLGDHIGFFVTNNSTASYHYNPRMYYYDLEPNIFYNLSFYLPPTLTEMVTNDSYYYLITVINEAGQTIDNAYLVIKTYMATIDEFVNVTTGYTDGNGQFTAYLKPNTLYKINCSKDGYEDSLVDYIPSPSVYTFTIKMYVETETPSTTYLWYEQHVFNGYLNNATSRLYVNYTDYMSQTEDWQVYIWRLNNDSTNTLVATYSGTNDSFQLVYPTSNICDYHVLIWVNHTTFGRAYDEWTTYGYHYHPSGKAAKFNLLMSANFAWNPFGWSNTVGFIIVLGVMFSFGRRETYMSMLLLGVLLIFLDVYIGFPTVWNTLASGVFPVIIIFLAILMLIRDRGGWGSS